MKKSRLILIVFLIFVLVAYLFTAKIYLPRLVQSEIANFSEDRGVDLSAGSVSFDFFSGLGLRDVRLGDSVAVDRIKIRPSYLPLIFSGEIIINNILIDSPLITIDEELPKNIIKIQKKGEQKEGAKQPGRNIEIGTLDIDDLIIKLGETEYSLRELDIEMPYSGSAENIIKLEGSLENDSFRQEVNFISDIEFNENKTLNLNLVFTDFKQGDITGFLRFPSDVSIYVTADIDYSKGLYTAGKLTIINSLDKTESGTLNFDLSHKKDEGLMSINSLEGNIGGVLTLDMKGLAGEMPDNGKLNLNGKLFVPEAAGLEPWLPFLEKTRISGSLETDNILVKKDGPATTVASGITAGAFSIDFGDENKLTAENLKTDNGLEFTLTKKNDDTRYGLKLVDTEYRDFKFLDYESKAGTIKNLSFNYFEDNWDVRLTSAGPEVLNKSLDVVLGDYLLNLEITNNEELNISGDIKGADGRYSVFNLLGFFTKFDYSNNKLVFNGLEAGLEKYGDIFVYTGSLIFPGGSGGEYLLEIKHSKFDYTDPGIKAEEISGLFTIKGEDGGTSIQGRIIAEKGHVYGNLLEGLSFDFYTLGDDYKISNIKGSFLGGTITGSSGFKTLEKGISFNTGLTLTGIETGGISSREVIFKSNGTISDGLFSDTTGNLTFNDLNLGRGYTEEGFKVEIDFTGEPETISIVNGFITNDAGKSFEFTGGLKSYTEEKRVFKFLTPEIPMDFLIDLLAVFMPDNTFILDVQGSVAVDFDIFNFLTENEEWSGVIKINGATVSAYINDTEVLVENVDGSITIREIEDTENRLGVILGSDLTISRSVFKQYLSELKEKGDTVTRDYIKIGKFKYGFLEMENIEGKFELDNDELSLIYLTSDLYNGNLFASGIFNFGDAAENYNINLLFSNLSLKSISKSLPAMEGYITGIVDGLIWFSVGSGYTSINGPFAFWAKDSRDEKRTIGRALLEKIGATGRFFTGSSRRYDKGEIAGYIKDGFITFKKFIISNRILGYTDLKIQADKRQNSITVKHLFSVIRELARRASRGDVQIDFQ